ncbi:MAG: glutamyl-tRNA reductase [Longimicrobiaceae bacterium]
MPLAVVGVSHQTSPVEVRERFACGRAVSVRAVTSLVDSGSCDEAALLSTCNRTEVILSSPGGESGVTQAEALLAGRAGLPLEEARRYVYVLRDRRAAEHLFRVAAGLESMILGEPQIQGQVREAYQLARQAGCKSGPAAGAVLHRLFQTALGVGGRVREETGVGEGAASVSSAAVELVRKIFGDLKGRRALVLGAGEMSETTLARLHDEGVRASVVANRTRERAVEIAERWGARAVGFEDFSAELGGVDVVICSTAAPHPVLTRERFRAALPHGPAHPLCIIDIALPRDVAPELEREPNVFLYNIDDLRQVVSEGADRRAAELPRAESMVTEAVDDFWSWYSGLAVVPTIRQLRARAERVRRAEVDRVLRRLRHLPPEDQEAIDVFTRALMNKVLHAPTVRLKEAVGNGRGTAAIDTARYLFELDREG